MARRSFLVRALVAGCLIGALVAPAAGAAAQPQATPPGHAHDLPVYNVGTAVVDISPPADHPQYLGGFGQMDEPTATVHDPLQVRAFAVSQGKQAVAFAIVDSQGWFSGYQEGPFGITDARQQVGDWLAKHGYPDATEANVIISSTHSHAAPTIMGIWGPTDADYLKLVHDRAIQAIEQAFSSMRPATLWTADADVATIDGSNVEQTDIYDGWTVDGDLPLLWARDPQNGKTIGLYGNVPIHADIVNGAGLKEMSADHIGFERDALGSALGGTAVLAMGTLGRQESIVQVGGYDDSHRVADYVVNATLHALESAEPITSDELGAAEQYVTVPGTNPALLALVAGNAAGPTCTPAACTIDRSFEPPYQVGTALGTWINVFRIGDVAYVSEPGEAFPEVSAAIRASIPADKVRVIGMAQDQVGYYFPPEDTTFTTFPNDSDHLIYNSSLALADINVDAAAVAARSLGWDALPVHPTTGIDDPQAFEKPGVQFFPVVPFSKDKTVVFDAAFNSAYDGAALVGDQPVKWDFGDGSKGESRELISHTYQRPGDYKVTATVTDEQGRSRSWTQTVHIH
ncbi:MAG TPA: PKD domain-containing protein [Actinomycetota bacterium]|nr:PKD domain-containing protein [Actinomycetota bacterium]